MSLSADVFFPEWGTEVAPVQPQPEVILTDIPVADATPVSDPADADASPKKKLYRKVIDLGDGSGKQIFQAATPDELADKLATAQENATRKIRELNQRVKELEKVPHTSQSETSASPEDEFALSQMMMTEPTKAFAKIFEQTVGVPLEDFKSRAAKMAAWEQAQENNRIALEFMAETPEYLATPKNEIEITKFLANEGLPFNKENLTYAYQELSSGGLLEAPKPVEAVEETRIEIPKPKRKTMSGLSQSMSAQPVPAKLPTVSDVEAEIEGMSIEQARERIATLMRQQQQKSSQ